LELLTCIEVFEPMNLFMDPSRMLDTNKRRHWADPAFRERMLRRRESLDTRGTIARRRPTRVWWHKGDVEKLASAAPGDGWKRGRKRKATSPRLRPSL